jgi:hypothetical protein
MSKLWIESAYTIYYWSLGSYNLDASGTFDVNAVL